MENFVFMSEDQFKLPLSTVDIMECIPHRPPFLLVDRVTDYKVNEYIHGYKNITVTEPILQGHFPGNPIVPGVIIIEALAQISGVLGRISKGRPCQTNLLMEINETRFRKQVVPGDRLNFHVKVNKIRGDFYWFEGQADVDGSLAAKAKFSAKLV